MSVMYRPHRGGLEEAMREVKVFPSVKAMLEYIVLEHKNAFRVGDIYMSYYGYDDRIDWETFIITVARYFDRNYMKEYNCPQVVGFCRFDFLPSKEVSTKRDERANLHAPRTAPSEGSA